MKCKVLFALAISASLLTACFGGGSEDYYYAFKESSAGKWGLVSPSGKVLFEGEFKDQPTDAVGGLFLARTGKDNMWQIYEATAKPSPVSDDSFKTIFPFTEDVTLAVKEEGDILIVDKKGTVLTSLEKAGADYIGYALPFNEGLAVVGTSIGFGAINTKGEVVVKPKYCMLTSFSDGVAIGLENKYKDEKNSEDVVYSVINAKGETLVSLKDSKYSDFKAKFNDGLMPVCKKDGREEKWGFINKKGEEVVKPTAKNLNIGDWNSSIYVFSDGKQWGLKRISNDDVLIRCKYDVLKFADKDGSLLWAGEKKGYREYKWTLINKKGDEITKDSYKDYQLFHGDYAPVKVSDSEWTVINRKGEEQKLKADIHTVGGYDDMPEAIFSQRLAAAMRWRRSNPESILDALEELAEEEAETEDVGDLIEDDLSDAVIAAAEAAAEEVLAAASASSPIRSIIVTGDKVRVRKGPGLDYDPVTDASGKNIHPEKGDVLEYLGEAPEFYRVRFRGYECWISKQFAIASDKSVTTY